MTDAAAILDATDNSSPLSVPASQTALLLLDFHPLLVDSMPPEGQAAVHQASSLCTWARSQNMTIIHCRIDFGAKPSPRSRMAARALQVHDSARKMGPDAVGAVPELSPQGDEYIFWRPLGLISALSSYGLNTFLQSRGVESVVLAGVATSGCVVDTAKAATEGGLVVTVVRDACADRVVETHEFITQTVLLRQCHVVGVDELVAAWK